MTAAKFDFPGGRFDVLYSPTAVTLANFSAVPKPGAIMLLAAVAGVAMVRRRSRAGLR